MNEMNKKRALIIGGSGGLSSVVAQIAMDDYEVWTVTRGKRPLPEGIKPIIADRSDTEAWAEAILKQNIQWDVVFDCICMNAKQAKQDVEILSKVTKRLVVVSTDSVYSPYYKRTPQDENGVFIEEEGDLGQVSYGCNKRRMEVEFIKEMQSDNPRINITVFRPGHIYGPGFLLGCFPENSRQSDLPELIRSGKHLQLVGMGTYIIQPIFVDDLASVIVECADNEKTFNEIFCIGGPDAVENRIYYEYIGKAMGCEIIVDEIPLQGYLEKHPEYSGHLCHRIYDLSKLKATGIKMPATKLEDGIRMQLKAMGEI